MIKKIIPVIYFIGLFLLLASYILFSSPDVSLRLIVATADELAPDRPNYVRVIAKDLHTGSVFRGFRLRSCWTSEDHSTVPGSSCIERDLPENGRLVLEIPVIPSARAAALAVHLVDPDHHIAKSAYIPARTFTVLPAESPAAPQKPHGSVPDTHDILVPGSFLFDTPNEVFIITLKDGIPQTAPVRIRQIYGQEGVYEKSVTPSGAGISRWSPIIRSAADFEFTQAGEKFYSSFAAGDRPLHVAHSDVLVTPETMPVATVTPFGSPVPIVVDIFDRGAWIGQKYYPAEASGKVAPPPITPWEKPHIIYMRVSASEFADPASSQMMALIAAPHEIDIRTQAQLAVDHLSWDTHPEMPVLGARIPQASPREARDIRDTALEYLASEFIPDIKIRVRTDEDDKLAFAVLKEKHKSIANVVFAIWIAIGAAMFTVIIVLQSRARRRAWEAAESQPAVPGTELRAVYIAIIIVLLASLTGLLFYMMQLI